MYDGIGSIMFSGGHMGGGSHMFYVQVSTMVGLERKKLKSPDFIFVKSKHVQQRSHKLYNAIGAVAKK